MPVNALRGGYSPKILVTSPPLEKKINFTIITLIYHLHPTSKSIQKRSNHLCFKNLCAICLFVIPTKYKEQPTATENNIEPQREQLYNNQKLAP